MAAIRPVTCVCEFVRGMGAMALPFSVVSNCLDAIRPLITRCASSLIITVCTRYQCLVFCFVQQEAAAAAAGNALEAAPAAAGALAVAPAAAAAAAGGGGNPQPPNPASNPAEMRDRLREDPYASILTARAALQTHAKFILKHGAGGPNTNVYCCLLKRLRSYVYDAVTKHGSGGFVLARAR